MELFLIYKNFFFGWVGEFTLLINYRVVVLNFKVSLDIWFGNVRFIIVFL